MTTTTTTNYGWTIPQDSELVKDGAAAIRTLGNAADASLKTVSDAAIKATIVDAKGDLIAATAADTVGRLAVGADGYYLKANSSASTGLEWAAVSSGAYTLLSTTTLSGSTTTVSSISQSYTNLMVLIQNPYIAAGSAYLYVQINGAGGNVYMAGVYNNTAIEDTTIRPFGSNNWLSTTQGAAYRNIGIEFSNYADTTYGKPFTLSGAVLSNQGTNLGGVVNSASAITSIGITTSASTFSGGRVLIYGVK